MIFWYLPQTTHHCNPNIDHYFDVFEVENINAWDCTDGKFWDTKLEDDIQGEVATVATLEEYTLLLNSLCDGNVADYI